MNTELASVYDEKTVSLVVSDGPTLQKRYGKRNFRLANVVIKYQRWNGAPWVLASVNISGPYVKKDGTDGVDVNRESIFHHNHADYPWLPALIEQHMPGGDS